MTHKERCKHGCREDAPMSDSVVPECEHKESDQLINVCLFCGRVDWPKIETCLITAAIIYFSIHIIVWAYAGFSVVK